MDILYMLTVVPVRGKAKAKAWRFHPGKQREEPRSTLSLY
jgi:hypothetical protein